MQTAALRVAGLALLASLHASAPAAHAQQTTLDDWPFGTPAAEGVFVPPPCTPPGPFSDVPHTHLFCPWIQQLFVDQITVGCGAGVYCPGSAVTRGEMAVFLELAMRGTSTWSPIPAGAVMFFNLTSCPSGWTELAAARGRYLLGLPSPGTLGATVGTALVNAEDRPIGRHSHTITDPGHSHLYTPPVLTSTMSGSSQAGVGSPTSTSTETTGIGIDDAGSVPGTNAPYLQLLVCQKD